MAGHAGASFCPLTDLEHDGGLVNNEKSRLLHYQGTMIEQSAIRPSSLPDTARALSLPAIGVLIGALLIIAGIAYPTYGFGAPSGAAEVSRQLGLIFVAGECGVIAFALANGFSFDRRWRSLSPLARWLFAAWAIGFWWSSAFVSPAPPYAIAFCLVWLVQPLFAVALTHCMRAITLSETHRMSVAISVIMLLFCTMIARHFIFHPDPAATPGKEIIWQLAVPGFVSVRLFGAFCGALLALFVGLILVEDRTGRVGIVHYAVVTLAAGLTIWSGTRAAVLGFAIAMAIIFVMGTRPTWSMFARLVLCTVVAAFLASMLVPYGSPDFMLYHPDDLQTADTVSGGRLSLFTAVFEAFLRGPLIGFGGGASAWALPAGIFPHIQPHNSVLEFLLSWGLVGALPAFGLIAMATIRAHRIAWRLPQAVPFLAMLDCLLVMSLLDGMAHFAQHMMLIMISYAAIFAAEAPMAKSTV
jgi:exopolysaccharide production protein ExoQ